jgi:hypothetical protein
MAYPKQFLRLAAIGTLYGGEAFTFTLSLISDAESTPVAPSTVPDSVMTTLSTFWTTTDAICAYARLVSVKLNLIGTDGKYVKNETVEKDYATAVVGSYQAYPAPQVALAITLDTDVRRGLAHLGRFYLPGVGMPVSTDGRLSLANAQKVGNAAKLFVDKLNADSNLAGWTVGVTSNTREGRQLPVRTVRVGRVLDTIRSRRSSLDEGYVLYPVDPAGIDQ